MTVESGQLRDFMTSLAYVAEYVWPSMEIPLCTIDVPIATLAEQHGMPLSRWEESGLGSASGFGCRVPSGLFLFVEELDYARQYLGYKGPAIYVAATELIERGLAETLAIALAGLELSAHNLVWVQTEEGLQFAAELVRKHRQSQQGSTRP
jgi:hypothetical protein